VSVLNLMITFISCVSFNFIINPFFAIAITKFSVTILKDF
jgi:hypothetical protein